MIELDKDAKPQRLKSFCFLFIRMGDDRLEERTLEVINIPASIDDDILQLYFESRRSGGGVLTSFDRKGGKATIIFEDAEGRWYPCVYD